MTLRKKIGGVVTTQQGLLLQALFIAHPSFLSAKELGGCRQCGVSMQLKRLIGRGFIESEKKSPTSNQLKYRITPNGMREYKVLISMSEDLSITGSVMTEQTKAALHAVTAQYFRTQKSKTRSP